MVKSIALSSGVTLQYAERGLASGVPVILLHGVDDSWRSFEGVLDRLPPTIHAFALTQRGHGCASTPEGGYRHGDLSEDLRGFMDALGLPAAVIVGHSMGGMVVLRFAADHPERVAGLVLIDPFQELHEMSAAPPALAGVRVPALIAWGEHDAFADAARQQALRAAIPGSRLLVYRGGGHAEDPVRFASDIVSFVYERRA